MSGHYRGVCTCESSSCTPKICALYCLQFSLKRDTGENLAVLDQLSFDEENQQGDGERGALNIS